jgi:hypothetical protein
MLEPVNFASVVINLFIFNLVLLLFLLDNLIHYISFIKGMVVFKLGSNARGQVKV